MEYSWLPFQSRCPEQRRHGAAEAKDPDNAREHKEFNVEMASGQRKATYSDRSCHHQLGLALACVACAGHLTPSSLITLLLFCCPSPKRKRGVYSCLPSCAHSVFQGRLSWAAKAQAAEAKDPDNAGAGGKEGTKEFRA